MPHSEATNGAILRLILFWMEISARAGHESATCSADHLARRVSMYLPDEGWGEIPVTAISGDVTDAVTALG